ncbi:MAG: hypothetical protein HC837_02715 [Chloroflexaceae bacterium]|nr:hypothetical protein [Chloroflexaceae bacterium]
MQTRPLQGQWLYSAMAIGLSLMVLGILYTLHLRTISPVQAQDQELGLEMSKSLVGDEVVQVGQILEFNVRVRNTGTLPITRLVVLDQFDSSIMAPTGIGPFAEPDDPPLSDPPGEFDGTDTIIWDTFLEDLPGQQLEPGQEVVFQVFLRAVRPTEELMTVNRSEIIEAIRSDGEEQGETIGDDAGAGIGGNMLPLENAWRTLVLSPLAIS